VSGTPVDVLLVSLGATSGLRAADEELCESLRRAGATVALATAARPREVRTFAFTDLAWALAARRAAKRAIEAHRPRAVIYSSVTSALLWPREGAIRFDALAASNRPGRHGVWQRPLERARLAAAPLLLPCADGSLDGLSAAAQDGRRIVLPIPVQASGPAVSERDIAAITYAANPTKKGLDRVLAAWRSVRLPGEQLVVAGAPERELSRAGIELPRDEGVMLVGMVTPQEYRGMLRRARVFICAPRREDYGIAQLEALADGCMLVTTPAPGPYAALALARQLDARLVSEDLCASLRAALDHPHPDYEARSQRLLAPWRREAVDALVADQLLPRLMEPLKGASTPPA
jgi:hypothetical protein